MITAYINGIECKFCYEERFSPEQAPLGYPYMYYLRHDEDNWTIPVMLERFVLVNFFGTVFMKEPVDFGTENYIDVKHFEMKSDYIVFNMSALVLKRIFGLTNG